MPPTPTPTPKAILPHSTIGVLGSGQLGRMFAIAARKMGYRVHTLSPDTDTPTGQVADVEIVADYDDLDAVAHFAKQVHVVTFEFENVSAAAADTAAKYAPVRPAGRVLHTTQHRLREKTFLKQHNFPHAPFAPISTLDDLKAATKTIGLPAVLKTAGFGYDGKGQSKITTLPDIEPAWQSVIGSTQSAIGNSQSAIAILESFIPFQKEVSVVAARGLDGDFAHWGVIENHHVNAILDLSTAPADLDPRTAKDAIDLARAILETLDVVGVLCVEFFLTADNQLLVNELAPRPHNSGHLTFDASVTSQFEQQLRAVCGLPLGDTRLHRPAAMAQLLGDLWIDCDIPPQWHTALRDPHLKLHLYGKTEPRKGRKMGHLTAMADSTEDAKRKVLTAREALCRVSP